MNLLINLNPSIDSLNQLSPLQARKLANVSKFNARLVHLRTTNDYETNLHTISQSLNRIHARVGQCPSTKKMFIQIFKNIFKNNLHTTLNSARYCYKIFYLRKSLPKLIASVNHEVILIFNSMDPNSLENEKSKLDPVSSPSSLQKQRKIKALQELHSDLIANKWQAVNRVNDLFHSQNPDKSSWDQVAHEIDGYVQGKLNFLSIGQDVALPRFFHATQVQYWTAIIKSKKIMQTHAALGFGAYVSTNDESCARYGPYTLALDESAIYPYKGFYYRGRASFIHKNSVWVRMHRDIEITPKTVAHFVTNDPSKCQESYVKLIQELDCDIPVITREASNRIIQLFNQAVIRRDLPKTWKQLPYLLLKGLPKNVYHPT